MKKNDEVLEKITKLDEKINVLDDKIIESKLFIEKLQSVENKLDKFKALESEAYIKDSLLGELNCKVTAIENTLDDTDKIIKTLMEKIEVQRKDKLKQKMKHMKLQNSS